MPNTNPAARLRKLLEEAQAVPHNANIATGWRQVLKIDEGDLSTLLERLSPVLRLPAEVQRAVRGLGDQVDQELCLGWVPLVERSFTHLNLAATWDQFVGHLDAQSFLTLRFASDQLQRLAPEPLIEQDELQHILSEVRALLDLVGQPESTLDPELRAFLHAQLKNLVAAIEDYRFRGTPALREAVAGILGHTLISPSVRSTNSPDLRRFWKVVTRLALVIGLAANARTLFSGVERLLLPAVDAESTSEPSEPPVPDRPDDGAPPVTSA